MFITGACRGGGGIPVEKVNLISLKRYLDGVKSNGACDVPAGRRKGDGVDLVSALEGAYRSALASIGRCSLDVCPETGGELQMSLKTISAALPAGATPALVTAADQTVQAHLQEWGRSTARHYQKTAAEVKDIMLVMARTAESVGDRDQRCAQQITDVTSTLKTIAKLEDLTLIRSSIEKSASELKDSIERMTAEGKAALDHLQARVSVYQAKLEEAEQIACYDSLTRLRSRLWVEGQIEQRISSSSPFCVAILDIDDFKSVNDQFGHVMGDELLRKFASELRSACRSSDIIGRWGGDEFILLLDCALPQAQAQIDRLSKWVCGKYTLEMNSGANKLQIEVSIGMAEHESPETMEDLLHRADVEMYRQKIKGRPANSGKIVC